MAQLQGGDRARHIECAQSDNPTIQEEAGRLQILRFSPKVGVVAVGGEGGETEGGDQGQQTMAGVDCYR